MTITPEQIKAARRLLGWSCIELAMNSPVGLAVVRNIEGKRPGKYDRAILELKATLEAAGVTFVDEKGFGAGVRLTKPSEEPGARRAIERAFELARSGSVGNAAEVKQALLLEGHDSGKVEAPQLRQQLRYLIREARGTVEPEPELGDQ